jgi:hypothetical protein
MSEFASHTNINWSGAIGVVEYGGGARAQLAIFYNKSVHNPQRSQQEGRPVFEDKIYVRVAPPGERLNVVDRPATRGDQQRWPTQWASFQQNKEQTPEGTPIELLYPEKPAVAATLRANGVMTIEQCAELSGNAIDSVGMGAQQWTNAAQKYVSMANKGVALTQHRKDLEQRDAEIRVLHQQVDSLQGELSSLLAQKAADGRQLSAIQEMLAANMGHPRRVMSKQTRYDLNPEDYQMDFEQERVNYRSTVQEVQSQPPRFRRPPAKSIMNAPDPGYDVQSERINNAEAQRTRAALDKHPNSPGLKRTRVKL